MFKSHFIFDRFKFIYTGLKDKQLLFKNDTSQFFFNTLENGENSMPTLKSLLNKLYKLVHPDLLHSHPKEREANERSFQVLQEYLSLIKYDSKHVNSHGIPKLFIFEFYLKVESSKDSSLKRVDLILPPPQRAFSPGENMHLSTKLSLGKLFSAFLLPSEFISPSNGREETKLSELFRQSRELFLQSQQNNVQYSVHKQVLLLRTALRFNHGLTVAFDPLLEEDDSVKALQLERLGRVVESIQNVHLKGCSIVVGFIFTVDLTGRLWLESDADESEWSAWLTNLDMRFVYSRTSASKWMQVLEYEAASNTKLGMFFTDTYTSLTHQYSEFLCRMRDESSEQGPFFDGKFSQLPVRVAKPSFVIPEPPSRFVQQETGSFTESFALNERYGFITVPIESKYSDVSAFLSEKGEEALLLFSNHEQRRKIMVSTTEHVKKKLRLKALAKGEGISEEEYLSACSRLLRHASYLLSLTDGLSIIVSTEHRLPAPPSYSMMHLKWNFSMDDF